MNSQFELTCNPRRGRRVGVSLAILAAVLYFGGVAAASPLHDKSFQDPVTGQTVGMVVPLSAFHQQFASGRVTSLGAGDVEKVAIAAIRDNSQKLGLPQPDAQLKKQKLETDDLGVTHVQFQQVMGQVPVFGSQVTVHVNPSRDSVMINNRVSQRKLDRLAPSLSPADALQRAEAQWQREYSSQPTLKRTPKLFVLDTGLLEDLSSGNIYLAFQVDLGANNLAVRYFIDAITGDVAYKIPLSASATKRLVYDCSVGDGACYLDAYSGFWGYTFGRSEGQPSRGANPINLVLIQTYPNETDRLYVMLGAAHDYFGVTFNRNGANGVGGLGDGSLFPIDTIPAVSYGDYKLPSLSCPNALFNPMLSRLEFCTGLMLVDTVGHELTHGLIHYTADLIYQGQSGALNESFADIFGEAVERFARGSHDWLLGASSVMGTLRSMIDPTAQFFNPHNGLYSNGGHPDRFHSPLYQCGTGDAGGVHSNSGVLNHAAYLIAAGGTFNGCSIAGIGEAKMEQIMYRALTRYLSPSSKFYDAYLAIRTAALELYSLEDFLQVERALRAVELPQAGYCSGLSPADTGCSALVDNCPSHANQLDPGQCGCGVSSADRNKNGRPDCFDPTASTVPTAPVVSLKKTQAKIAFQKVPGATYNVELTLKGSRPKKVTTKSNPYVATLKKGNWTVTYRIALGGVVTKISGKKGFIVK